MNRPPAPSTPASAAAAKPAPPLPPLASWREALVALAIVAALFAAFRVFDEAREPLKAVTRLVVPALVLFFGGRWLWRWLRSRPDLASRLGVTFALLAALAGWLDVAFVSGVRGLSQGNFALIVLGPLALLTSLLAALAGVAGAIAGGAAARTAFRHAVPRRALVAAGGIAGLVLNAAHVVRLAQVWLRR